jgi:hypothetical protein
MHASIRPIFARGYVINRERAPLGWITVRRAHQGRHVRRTRYVRWTALLAILLSASTGWLAWPLTRSSGHSSPTAVVMGARAAAKQPGAPNSLAKPPGPPAAILRPGVLPDTAVSHYLKTTRPPHLLGMGCREAKRLSSSKGNSAVAVLGFGRPVKGGNRQWGASLFGNGYRSTDQIQGAAQAYAEGYVDCSRKGLRLTIAIGTSNYGPGVSYRHGTAWAQMVNAANRWLDDKGYTGRVEFAGANDIELSWNGPRASKDWVRGYDSVAEWPYYNYGDAAGCPPRGDCAGAWTPEDVWFVSWGARTAWPLPQIYTPSGSMAQQWYRLSLYSFLHHGWRMTIAGVLSQRIACHQSSDPCRGMDNSPAKAWGQLSRLLNRDRRTAQHLPWSSDFSWGS